MSKYVEQYQQLDQHADALEERAEDYKSRAEDDRWEQCRIVHAACESGEFSQRTFAEAVGKSQSTVGRQYRMWKRWGESTRTHRPTYWEAQAEVRNHTTGENRTKEIARTGVRRLSTQEKAEVVRELIEDEEVATAAVADQKTRASLAKADEDVRNQTRESQREHVPEIRQVDDDRAVLETLRMFTRLRRELRKVMDDLKAERLTGEDREQLEDAARRTINAIELFATTLRTEEWDDALARIVEGGDA